MKLAQLERLEQIIVLSVPFDKEPEQLKQRIMDYAHNYKTIEGKPPLQIAQEMEPFENMPLHAMNAFQTFIQATMEHLIELPFLSLSTMVKKTMPYTRKVLKPSISTFIHLESKERLWKF